MKKCFFLFLAAISLAGCSSEDTSKEQVTLPTITTSEVSSIETGSAMSGGTITAVGNVAITSKGICWSTTPGPTVSNDKTSESGSTNTFTSEMTGLLPNTQYYVRAYVAYNGGTVYGNQINFTTKLETATDIDENVYNVVSIGSQKWMKQNLNVSHYRNGDVIPQATSQAEWNNAITGMWCYYAGNTANGTVYGKLYNWYAVNDSRGLAPEGWHVATQGEWTQLITDLGGTNTAGGPMKALTQWASPNTGATNDSGFSALPGGFLMDGGFAKIGISGFWWTSTEDPQQNALAMYFVLYNDSTKAEVYHHYKHYGLSVRCVKD